MAEEDKKEQNEKEAASGKVPGWLYFTKNISAKSPGWLSLVLGIVVVAVFIILVVLANKGIIGGGDSSSTQLALM